MYKKHFLVRSYIHLEKLTCMEMTTVEKKKKSVFLRIHTSPQKAEANGESSK